MIKRFFAVIALSLLTGSVCAAVITANSSYTDSTGGNDFALGQSVTTPSGGPWDNISFNFINSAGSPYANGTLYLLALEYLGTTVGLSSSTPGFVATSSSSAGGIWAFASSVALQAATTYWFYMDTLFDGTEQVRYSAVNPYAGGSSYQADGAAGTFSAHV
ncbi:MAG: hypothetical protein OEO84_00950, partial [Betaproteobacteria bacterium]|nr:hypothetical protein [Betaproteobacteria bacterium]